MRKYYGEVADLENWEKEHRVITVEANDSQEAFKKVTELKKEDENIYQISRDFDDCSCPQPVYDFFNAFRLAGNEATATTWAETRCTITLEQECFNIILDCWKNELGSHIAAQRVAKLVEEKLKLPTLNDCNREVQSKIWSGNFTGDSFGITKCVYDYIVKIRDEKKTLENHF